MSGGSMDYVYGRVESIRFDAHTPERAAFAAHLQLVAQALHDIEWVDSCDYSPGDENAAIRACIGDGPVLDAAIDRAHQAAKELRAELERACGRGSRK